MSMSGHACVRRIGIGRLLAVVAVAATLLLDQVVPADASPPPQPGSPSASQASSPSPNGDGASRANGSPTNAKRADTPKVALPMSIDSANCGKAISYEIDGSGGRTGTFKPGCLKIDTPQIGKPGAFTPGQVIRRAPAPSATPATPAGITVPVHCPETPSPNVKYERDLICLYAPLSFTNAWTDANNRTFTTIINFNIELWAQLSAQSRRWLVVGAVAITKITSDITNVDSLITVTSFLNCVAQNQAHCGTTFVNPV